MKAVDSMRVGLWLTMAVLISACGGGSSSGSGGGGDSGGTQPDWSAIDEAGGMPAGYSLVWSDEFDVDGLPNSTKWNYDTSANSTGWYNNELQYYSNARTENSRVHDGVLIIDALHESASGLPGARASSPQEYTSARLITQGKASWTYAFVEVRAKLPCTQGAWPAIWTLADVSGMQWPLDGEMDIMEHVNSDALIHFSVHTSAHNHTQNTQATNQHTVTVCDGSFHNYQLTWTADEVLIGMDDHNYLRYHNAGTGKTEWPFNGPQFILLNVAVGGDWPGSPTVSSVFPMRMEVDYVRVYQK
jgi:beta-glucanase (GH16 family)